MKCRLYKYVKRLCVPNKLFKILLTCVNEMSQKITNGHISNIREFTGFSKASLRFKEFNSNMTLSAVYQRLRHDSSHFYSV